MGAVRLLIADHHCMVGEALSCLLESKEYSIIGNVGNWEDCLKKLTETEKYHVDLLILDLMMPGEHGLELLSRIQENRTRVLVLTGQKGLRYFEKAVALGVDGYLLKTCSLIELKKAIEVVVGGGKYVQNTLVTLMELRKRNLEKMSSLTKRELEVLEYLAFGMYNKEIAIKLEISERTVKNHVANIFKKIKVADRTQAAVFAIRSGLVEFDE
ncbi:MAG: response regulator transcription factor [Eubacterium sp.]|jgi:two-component system response regulator DegU|nr:response regulator transcription factor [Eubacterium sp.]NBI85647.1 DNA-binding response regulator [Lachnospiraceae bacterium]